jgi:RNA polymerase sigma factor (sigma-70 family)
MTGIPSTLRLPRKPPGTARQGFAATGRRDEWALAPGVQATLFTICATYLFVSGILLWPLFQPPYQHDGYLSPLFSPLIAPSWLPTWISPGLLILWIPLGFRATCYYYRKAYYRIYFADPPGCWLYNLVSALTSGGFPAGAGGASPVAAGGDPFPYTLVTARNLAKRTSRLARRALLHSRFLLPSHTSEDEGGRLEIQDLVSRLPERERWTLVLSDFLELPSSEVAKILHIAPSTARVHLARARAKIRLSLRESRTE